MTRALVLLMVVAAVSLQQGSARAPKRVEIIRMPSFLFSDERFTVKVRVPLHAENRLLVVGVWDEGMPIVMSRPDAVRISLEQLDGEGALVTRDVSWPYVPAGDFELRAYVFGTTGQIAVDRRPLEVLARWQ